MDATSLKDQRRLYSDLAWTWPIISPPEDYVEEAEAFCQAVKEHALGEVRTVLHLGCDGGHADLTLKKHFEVTGVDVSEDMLALARRLNPEVTYLRGDMRTVRLEKTFDATMIFDSLAYMVTEKELASAFTTAFVHLRPGGVFCTFVEETLDRFQQNKTRFLTHKQGDVTVTLIENYFDPDPADTSYEATLVCLIRRGTELEIETDRHLCGVFPLETWLDVLREVGFEVIQKEFRTTAPESGTYPLLVCVKPS